MSFGRIPGIPWLDMLKTGNIDDRVLFCSLQGASAEPPSLY
jgi:hypothetical protein